MNASARAGKWVSLAMGGLLPATLVWAAPPAKEPAKQPAAAAPAPSKEAAKPAPPETPIATIQDGMTVQLDYTLTVDGAVVDSSQGRGPISYVQGHKQIVAGLERQLAGLHIGDARDVIVKPEDGYGQIDPKAFAEVPKTQLPPDVVPAVGLVLHGKSQDGHPFRATVSKVDKDNVTLDLNHPLAGKTLHFAVKVVNISAAQ